MEAHERDIRPDSVAALVKDTREDTAFHRNHWVKLQETHPIVCDFIERRLRQLFGEDTEAANKSLALIVELSVLEGKATFGSEMSRQLETLVISDEVSRMTTDQQSQALYDATPPGEIVV